MHTRQWNGMWMMWVAVMALIFTASGVKAAVYSGGAGTELNPYRIRSTDDWTMLAITTGDWDKHFILTGDIDFDGASVTPAGTEAKPFTGVFDGGGHVLRNGQIYGPENDLVGLFCSLGDGGAILNLGVEEVDIAGSNYVGGLVGYNDGGTMDSCYTTGKVAGGDYHTGGLVGYNEEGGTITSCHASGAVTGIDEVGGLAGRNVGTISGSYATGEISGDNYVGGLVGYIYETTVSLCYATGAVTGDSNIGGLVGRSYKGTITSCYARGSVMGDEEVGGLVGAQVTSGAITSCYATGAVAGNTGVGGLVGSTYPACTVTSDYWDTNTSGQTTSVGGEGRTTDEMTYPYAENTYVGWDFAAIWAADSNHSVNDGYPYLRGIVYPDDGACGCSGTTLKNLSPSAFLKRTLADWLLVGLSVLALVAFSVARK